MKSADPLLKAWEKTLAGKGDGAAILVANGEVSRTFDDIEQRARELAGKIDIFKPGNVVAIQIGNQADWPSILLACLRKGLIVLPLEQSISERERDAALEICNAAGVVAAGPSRTGTVSTGGDVKVLPMRTSAATTNWGDNAPTLLKLTSGTTAAPRAVRFRTQTRPVYVHCTKGRSCYAGSPAHGEAWRAAAQCRSRPR